MTARLEPLLVAALDAEWAAQSERSRPLVPSRFVYEALELAVAGTPEGIFGLAGELHDNGDTPEMLVQRLRDRLPASAQPWTLRLLERMCSLPARAERPQLPAPRSGPFLLVEPVEEESPQEVEPAPPAAPGADPPSPGDRRVKLAVAGAGVAGLVLGALLGVVL